MIIKKESQKPLLPQIRKSSHGRKDKLLLTFEGMNE